MPMKRCENGHYYDDAKHTSCPACGIPDLDIGKTVPRQPDAGGWDDEGKTRKSAPESGATKRRDEPRKGVWDDAGVTVAKVRKELDIDPVVGWLVCVKGPDRGRDYRIRSEKNFIGRGDRMDICIRGDETISRENHAAISYNYKNNSFKLLPGEGRGLVFLNNDEVDTPVALAAYDMIEIGNTQLLFVPFCGEKFQWQQGE